MGDKKEIFEKELTEDLLSDLGSLGIIKERVKMIIERNMKNMGNWEFPIAPVTLTFPYLDSNPGNPSEEQILLELEFGDYEFLEESKTPSDFYFEKTCIFSTFNYFKPGGKISEKRKFRTLKEFSHMFLKIVQMGELTGHKDRLTFELDGNIIFSEEITIE